MTPPSLRVFAVRHGGTEWSRAQRFTGSRDVPLADLGRRQNEAVAAALTGEAVAAVYTSPLGRALATAETIAKPHRLTVILEPALREMAFGDWEGRTGEELAATAPDAIELWRTSPDRSSPPGGERLRDVAERAAGFIARLRAQPPAGAVVLVSHAIVIRLLIIDALGLGLDRLWSVDASPGGLSEIEYQSGWVTVHRMNTVAHLDDCRP